MAAGLSSDFVVVGGGLVGAAIAYGLAKAGEQVLLLDEGDVAFRAARGNFGNVWVQGKGASAPPYADLTRQAAADWTSFAAELEDETGIPLHFRRPGAFYICFTEEELEKRAALMESIERRATVPSPYEVVGRAELARRLPVIGSGVAGATYCADDGTANPLHLLRALISGTCRFGGNYAPNRRVRALKPESGGFSIQTDGGHGPVRQRCPCGRTRQLGSCPATRHGGASASCTRPDPGDGKGPALPPIWHQLHPPDRGGKLPLRGIVRGGRAGRGNHPAGPSRDRPAGGDRLSPPAHMSALSARGAHCAS